MTDTNSANTTASAPETKPLPDLGQLFQEAMDSCVRFPSYRRAAGSSWVETGLYFVFLAGVVAVVTTVFQTIDQFRLTNKLMGITEVAPAVQFRNGGFTTDANLPYQAVYRGASQPLQVLINRRERLTPELNVAYIWLDMNVVRINMAGRKGFEDTRPIADFNLTINDEYIRSYLQERRVEAIPMSLMFGFVAGMVIHVMLAGVTLLALLALQLLRKLPVDGAVLTKVSARAITPAVFVSLLLSVSQLWRQDLLGQFVVIVLFAMAIGWGFRAMREVEGA